MGFIFKADGDYKKQISTNVSFTDNRWDLNKDPDKTKYLTGDSKWQQLIGQGYVKDNSLDADKDFEYDDSKLDFPQQLFMFKVQDPMEQVLKVLYL